MSSRANIGHPGVSIPEQSAGSQVIMPTPGAGFFLKPDTYGSESHRDMRRHLATPHSCTHGSICVYLPIVRLPTHSAAHARTSSRFTERRFHPSRGGTLL